MRVKFENCIEECKKIELCRIGSDNTNRLIISTFDNKKIYVNCVDAQEAEDLYNEAYINGYINISNRSCSW